MFFDWVNTSYDTSSDIVPQVSEPLIMYYNTNTPFPPTNYQFAIGKATVSPLSKTESASWLKQIKLPAVWPPAIIFLNNPHNIPPVSSPFIL